MVWRRPPVKLTSPNNLENITQKSKERSYYLEDDLIRFKSTDFFSSPGLKQFWWKPSLNHVDDRWKNQFTWWFLSQLHTANDPISKLEPVLRNWHNPHRLGSLISHFVLGSTTPTTHFMLLTFRIETNTVDCKHLGGLQKNLNQIKWLPFSKSRILENDKLELTNLQCRLWGNSVFNNSRRPSEYTFGSSLQDKGVWNYSATAVKDPSHYHFISNKNKCHTIHANVQLISKTR